MLNKKDKKIAIIGAGPAGLSAAYILTKDGYAVDVYEKENQVGGICKTIKMWGYLVDFGPHRFFCKEKKINQLWLEVVKKDYKMINRLTRILYRGKFFNYPLKPFNALFSLGISESVRAVLSYVKERISPSKSSPTWESWMTGKFGKRLYEIFFKGYSEKLWGIKMSEFSEDWASQRVKKFSLMSAILSSIIPKKQEKHHTLTDQFAYPLKGTGMVYERMADFVKRKGGNVYLNQKIDKVIVKNKKTWGIEIKNSRKKYDHVISCMPITSLVKNIDDSPKNVKKAASKLTYRNNVFVYFKIKNANVFPDQWIYINAKENDICRVTNFRNWAPTLYGKNDYTVLTAEYFCSAEDRVWKNDDKTNISLARRDIVKTKIVKPKEIVDAKVIKMSKSYPVYKIGYKKHLFKISEYLDSISGLHAIGRYGSFKYNNQDHSILMGMKAAEIISGSIKHNLWKINTDYEYQEKATITETGLVSE